MLNSPFENTDAQQLSRMLSLDATEADWTDEDLGQILRHQLDAPVADDHLPASAERTTIAVLLQPDPEFELLRAVKADARRSRHAAGGSLPPPVATVVYYAAIAVARLRGGNRITSMDDAALRRGLQWTLQRSWLDARLRPVLTEAAAALNAT